MKLEKLLLINYRNYHYQLLDFHPGLNVLIGENAQGKTNLLESIYLSARGRPYKNVSDKDLIRIGERSAYVRAEIDRKKRNKTVEVKLSMVDKKRVRINEIEVENLKELSNQFELVLFAPEDLQIIKEGPSFRRDYLDELLKGIDKNYGQKLRNFQKILSQRNNLLKNRKDTWFDDQLNVLNKQLVQASHYLIQRRYQIAEEVSREAEKIHSKLSQGREELKIFYKSNALLEDEEGQSYYKEDEFEDNMDQLLDESYRRDLEYKNTDIGPHKDDLYITINKMPTRKYASQGQSRTATLSMRLAELSILEEHNEIAPILLLDDVFSELDQYRMQFLLESIGSYQTILTSNEIDALNPKVLTGHIFKVDQGKIERLT